MQLRHAQRQHIVQSLELLLLQLYAVSYFTDPRLVIVTIRLAMQAQTRRPTETHPNLSLRNWIYALLVCDLFIIGVHSAKGPAEGRALVLDFVGQANTPTKIRLVFFDIVIALIQFIFTLFTYDTAVSATLFNSASHASAGTASATSTPPSLADDEPLKPPAESEFVFDFAWADIQRYMHMTPAVTPSISNPGLPMPNTMSSSWPLPIRFNITGRGRPQQRTRQRAEDDADRERDRMLPGGFES